MVFESGPGVTSEIRGVSEPRETASGSRIIELQRGGRHERRCLRGTEVNYYENLPSALAY